MFVSNGVVRLAAQAQTFDQVLVACFVFTTCVVQEFAAKCDHFQQTAATVVVFFVCLEVLCQSGDTRGQNCDLYFG